MSSTFLLYIRIPANTLKECWTVRHIDIEKLGEQIEYDKKWRWGQSLFVDGKCVHVTEMGYHTKEQIEQLEKEIKESYLITK